MVHLNIFPRHAYIALSLQAQRVTAITLKVTAVALGVFAAYAHLWVAAGAAVGVLALAIWVNRAAPVEEPRAAPIVPVVQMEPVGVMQRVVADLMAGGVRDRVQQLKDTTFPTPPPLERRNSVPVPEIPLPPPLPMGGVPPPPPVPNLAAIPRTPYRQSAAGHKKAATMVASKFDPKQVTGVVLKKTNRPLDEKKKEETPEALRRARARDARRAGSSGATGVALAPAQPPVPPKKATSPRAVVVTAAPPPPVVQAPPRAATPPRDSDGDRTPVRGTPTRDVEEEQKEETLVVRRGSLFEEQLMGLRRQMAPDGALTRAERTPHRSRRCESQESARVLDLAVSPSPPRPGVLPGPSRRGMSVHFQRQAKQLRHVSPPQSTRGSSAGQALFGERLDLENLTPRSRERLTQAFDSPLAQEEE